MPLDRRAESRPCAIEEACGVQIGAVLDPALRKLLARHFAGDVKQHDVPQITRLLVGTLGGGFDRAPDVLKQGMRCLVKQNLGPRPSLIAAVAACDDDVWARVE